MNVFLQGEDVLKLTDAIFEVKMAEKDKCTQWYVGKFFNSDTTYAIPRSPHTM